MVPDVIRPIVEVRFFNCSRTKFVAVIVNALVFFMQIFLLNAFALFF